jgi:hypothetical protein
MAHRFTKLKPPFKYRVVRLVREQPDIRYSKARLLAFGAAAIAAAAGCDEKTVRRAIADEQIEPESLRSIAEWIYRWKDKRKANETKL